MEKENIIKNVASYLESIEYLIIDECFVAGTRVSTPFGYRNIEEIEVGDIVCSYDIEKDEYVEKKVLRLFRKISKNILKIKLNNGKEIECTPNHKFWTDNGWKRADTLSCSDMVLCNIMEQGGGCEDSVCNLQRRNRKNKRQRDCDLQYMQIEKERCAEEKIFCQLCSLWRRSYGLWKEWIKTIETWQSLLQRRLQKILDVSNVFRNNECYEPQICIEDFKENEKRQSNVRSVCKISSNDVEIKENLETFNSRRKWSWFNRATSFIGSCFGLGNRSCYQYSEDKRLSLCLQSRYRKSRIENCNRDRWWLSLWKKKRDRSKERFSFDWIRVESVEIQKQRSNEKYNGVRKESVVYNLEVEDTHTYQVEGFVVSNCHHLGAKSWWKIAKRCKNTRARHGFSGTCFRTDNADLLLLAHTGDVISHYTTTYMIEEGWLSRPYIYRDTINVKVPSSSVWSDVEDALIVNNEKRNRAGCQFIYDMAGDGKQVLVMVKRVPHGRILKQMLVGEFGIESRDIRYMSGSEGTETRKRALLDYKYGTFPILIGTSIYDEGIDLPTIGAAANMGGGKSDIKTTQKLGRAIRKVVPEGEMDVDPSVEQTVRYYDPDDRGHRFVKKHSSIRQDVYEGEKAFVLKGEYNAKKISKTRKKIS